MSIIYALVTVMAVTGYVVCNKLEAEVKEETRKNWENEDKLFAA